MSHDVIYKDLSVPVILCQYRTHRAVLGAVWQHSDQVPDLQVPAEEV